MKKMKILIINDEAFVGFNLSKELIKLGHKVTLFTRDLRFDSYPHWVMTCNSKPEAFMLSNLNINDYDIIHDNYLINWSSLGLFFRMTRKPVVLHVHGDDTRPINIFQKIVKRLVARKSNIMLYSTPDLLKNISWFKGTKIYLPNPVNILHNIPKVKRHKNKILIFATLYKIKRIEYIFSIIKNLDFQFDIIDIGPDSDYYKKIAPPNVSFIKPIKNKDIYKELLKYPLVIGGSYDGTIRVCELESMSLGIPTLFPFKYNNLYTYPLPMPQINEKNIKKHFGNYQLGKKQRIWVKKHHDVVIVVDKLLKIYKDIILRNKK